MIRSEQKKRDSRIVEAYLKGEKIRFIAALFGIFPQRVYQILKKKGFTLDKRKKTFDK